MSGEVDRGQYVLPLDQPVVDLDATKAFEGLSDKEKNYAHEISKASWVGGLVTLLQVSQESGPLFVFFHKIFTAQKPDDFKKAALAKNFTEDEVKSLFVYACGVFSNAGNYKSFGDSKFVPSLEEERFDELLKVSSIWSEVEPLWNQLKTVVNDLTAGKTSLGYPSVGTTTYLSKNCTEEDTQKVQTWVNGQHMELYNTRLFKTEENGKIDYEIRLAGKNQAELKKETVDNITYRVTTGDYSPLMGRIADYLDKAIPYAANDNEAKMLQAYIQSFRTGSLDDHKDGSRYWIKDKGPAVESYIGFIETYRDPAGVRGEFEGFVAIVNREMSAKFTTLVSKAEQLLVLLPWDKGFEKDSFLKPDFTSLDVLTYGGSGIPAGINIPNYDDIRQNEGFKNVSLGNVISSSYQMEDIPFLSKSDQETMIKYRVPSFEVQVGLHELLGHGSGKLFRKELDGTFNFPPTLIDPLTGKPIASYYEASDTYDAKFGPLGSAYEECRAEAVGLYLSLEAEVLTIFGYEGQVAEDVTYANWLSMVFAGAGRGLEMWEPGRGWLQAHSQARFALSNVMIEAGIATVTQPSDDELLLTLDRSQLKKAGRDAIGNFLLKLQVYKATANVDAAQKLFKQYTDVNDTWLARRKIILAHKEPRKMFVQANTVSADGKVNLKTYKATTEGLIESWVDRFDAAEKEPLYSALLDLAKETKVHF